jgi:hypothetical protein
MGSADAGYLAAFPGNARVALASFSRAALQERRLVCVHEASHIVGALLVGPNPRVRLNTRRTSRGRAAFSATVTTRSNASDANLERNRGFVAAMGIVAEQKYCLANGLPEPSGEAFQTDFSNLETAGLKPETCLECARVTLKQPHLWAAVLRLSDEIELRWGFADEVNISADEIAGIVDIDAVRAMGA